MNLRPPTVDSRGRAWDNRRGCARSDGSGTTRPWTRNLRGPAGQLFGDPSPGPDETAFQVDNTSEEYYDSPYYKQHENDVEAVPMGPPAGAARARRTCSAQTSWRRSSPRKKISFHAVGDTGASLGSEIPHEAIGRRRDGGRPQRRMPLSVPAFFFHLGDVIYNFGEADYYYDQFYEPFRGYDRPIFAIPGNHDGAVTYTARRLDARRPVAAGVHRELLHGRRRRSPRTRAGWRARR